MFENLYDIIKNLCFERNVSVQRMEKDAGLSNGATSKWNTSIPKVDKLALVADYFSLPLEYFRNALYQSEQDSEETELLKIFRTINREGQEDLMKYARLISGSEQYKKSNKRRVVVEKA